MTKRRLYPIAGGVIGGVVLLVSAVANGEPPLLAAWLTAFGLTLGVAAGIDLRERRLPNAITYPGMVAVLAVALFGGLPTALSALGGLLVGGGLMSLAFWFGRGSLGMGDVKLSAFAGGFLGLGGVVPYLLFGTLLGAVVATALLVSGRGRRATFAYGPSLAAGAVLAAITAGPVVG